MEKFNKFCAFQTDNKAVESGHVTLEDLLMAFKETRPSVSKEELLKYKRM